MKTKNQRYSEFFQREIKAFLDKRAEEDELFAKSYSKEKKSIEECCDYIISEVQKSGRSGFADEEIYSMAVHYYDEDDLTVDKTTCPKVVVNRTIELSEVDKILLRKEAEKEYKAEIRSQIEKEEKKKAEEIEARRKKLLERKKKETVIQGDLFGGL